MRRRNGGGCCGYGLETSALGCWAWYAIAWQTKSTDRFIYPGVDMGVGDADMMDIKNLVLKLGKDGFFDAAVYVAKNSKLATYLIVYPGGYTTGGNSIIVSPDTDLDDDYVLDKSIIQQYVDTSLDMRQIVDINFNVIFGIINDMILVDNVVYIYDWDNTDLDDIKTFDTIADAVAFATGKGTMFNPIVGVF